MKKVRMVSHVVSPLVHETCSLIVTTAILRVDLAELSLIFHGPILHMLAAAQQATPNPCGLGPRERDSTWLEGLPSHAAFSVWFFRSWSSQLEPSKLGILLAASTHAL